MISHEIIKHVRPKVLAAWECKPARKISSQEELNEWLKNDPLKVGDFVTYYASVVTTVYQLYYVSKVETDFNKITFSYQGDPQTHQILQLRGPESYGNAPPWFRWSSSAGYKKLDEETKKRWVDDKLQDYIAAAIAAI